MDSLEGSPVENTNAILIFSSNQEIWQSFNKSGLGELTLPLTILFYFPKEDFSGCPVQDLFLTGSDEWAPAMVFISLQAQWIAC